MRVANLLLTCASLASMLGASSTLTGCASDGEAGSAAGETHDDIDVALGDTLRDYAKPDEAGPVWFGNSMFVSGAQYSTDTVRGFGTISESVLLYPKGRVSYGGTGTVGLAPGKYGVLVQFVPTSSAGRSGTLGRVHLLSYAGSDFTRTIATRSLGALGFDPGMVGDTSAAHEASDGFDRGYFHFELSELESKAATAHRIVIESNGTAEFETGLVSLHREGRPFFAIAHNPDSLQALDKVLAEGANALGPDLMYSTLTPNRIEVAHPNVIVNTACSSERDGWSDLRDYLRRLRQKAPRIPVLWDVKPNSGAWINGSCKSAPQNLPAFASLLQRIASEEHFDLSASTMSVPDLSMVSFFDSMRSTNTGRSIDGLATFVNANDVVKTWVLPAQNAQLTWSGLGISVSELRVTQKWTVPVAGLVRARETRAFPKKVDYWSVSAEWEIRRMLDLGVDGLIADSVPVLRRVLAQEPYRSIYKYADTRDSSFEKFGDAWMCQRACQR